jgi:hypothetical protein
MPHQRNRYLNDCLLCPVIGEQELSEEEFYQLRALRFNIAIAQQLCQRHQLYRVPSEDLERWLDRARIDKEHINHLPPNLGPGIMGTLPRGSGMPLIDGNHRAARSLINRTEFQVFILDETETLELLRRSMGTAAADYWWQRLLASKPHPND